MEKVNRGPYIDAYCQVWFHLVPSDGNTSYGLGPGELKNDEKRAITPRRVIKFTSKLQGM
jgi:hypothetical protein